MKNKKTLVSVVSVFMALLMVLVNLSLPVGAASENLNGDSTVQAPVNPEDKIDSALKEKMATASPDEKIPVAIWYTDVDQEQIDTLTTQKVGYSQDDIAVDYEMPSTALLSDLKDGKEGADAEMQAYMERTEQQREKERERTDEYIMTRREFSRTKYNEKSAKIIKDVAINEEDIIFKSQYAPMIIAELTASDIVLVGGNNVVINIISYEEPTEVACSASNIKEYTGYNDVVSILSLTGEGVKIGTYDGGNYPLSGYTELNYNNIIPVGEIGTDDHFTNTARILIGTENGFAPDAKIYSVKSEGVVFSDVESLLSYGVQLINLSYGWIYGDSITDSSYAYSIYDKWFDHVVSQHNVTVVASAGNAALSDDAKRVLSPAMGYNVIAVGGYDDNNTISYDDDVLYDGSNYVNSNGTSVTTGAEKPDVIMSKTILDGGTSSSAPILSGFIALMMQLKPSLADYPQAIKAIVLASCHRKVLPAINDEVVETMYQGITERQGAGVPDFWTMACIVSQGFYGVGTIDTESTNDFVRFTYPNYDGANNMNVSVTWLRDSCFVDSSGNQISNPNHATDTLQASPAVDVDLTVYRNGTYIKDSTLSKSSTEMAYFAIDNTNFDYTIKISKESNYDQLVKYGYAFSTDASALLSDTSVGIYQIKNLETDTYLTLDPQTNEIKLQEYSGADTQKWILKRPNVYQIYSGYEDTAGMLNRGNLLSTNNYKAIVGPSTLNLTKIDWLTDSTYGINGAVRFYTYFGGTQCYLSYSGTNVTLSSQSASTDVVSWILEKLYYRIGDVNMDGIISQADSRSIGYYLADSVEYNNMQIFLADANGDGLITIHDRTAIQEMYEENE